MFRLEPQDGSGTQKFLGVVQLEHKWEKQEVVNQQDKQVDSCNVINWQRFGALPWQCAWRLFRRHQAAPEVFHCGGRHSLPAWSQQFQAPGQLLTKQPHQVHLAKRECLA